MEFLIVPDPMDAGQLTASIEAVENVLKDASRRSRDARQTGRNSTNLDSRVGELPAAERDVMTRKLSLERQRFSGAVGKFYERSAGMVSK